MSGSQPSDAFWATLESAKRSLVDSFELTRVEYVVGFIAPWGVHVWLGTDTDTERDRLLGRPRLNDDVASVLLDAGLERAGGAYGGVTVQSEETVSRDFEGSWFYALR